jgi:hypothetical protein
MLMLNECSLHGDAMQQDLSRSPSVGYTTASEMDHAMGTASSLSHQQTPAFSPAPTQATLASQPNTPFNNGAQQQDVAAMSAPRYTVSQFNSIRRSSQDFSGSFLSPNAK